MARGGRKGRKDRQRTINYNPIKASTRQVCAPISGLPNGHPSKHSPVGSGSSNFRSTVMDRSVFHAEGEYEEQYPGIPCRRPLEVQQHLRLFPQQLETEAMKFRQLTKQGKAAGHTSVEAAEKDMVSGTNERLTWKSDRRLLIPGKPMEHIGAKVASGAYGFKRVTSFSKRTRTEVEEREQDTVVTVDNPLDIKL